MLVGQNTVYSMLAREALRVLRDRLDTRRLMPPVLYGPDGRVVESSVQHTGCGATVQVRIPMRFRATHPAEASDDE